MTGPSTPPELEAAMDAALDGKASPTAEDLLVAAEHLLERVLRTDCQSRASALDLLTVDALMTRALEEAAADPASADDFAVRAIQRIAALHRE
jgi:hypothetical protein